MMGGKLHPSVPSLGVCIAQPAEAGKITLQEHRPMAFMAVLHTLQTEEMDMVEFAPIESLDVRPAQILNVSKVVDGELYRLGNLNRPTVLVPWKLGINIRNVLKILKRNGFDTI